jgi:hypothetical protein
MLRLAVVLPLLFVPPLLEPGLWLLAAGTQFTSLQRLWYVYKHIN